VKREHVAFLLGGLAFGILFGFGLAHGIATRPGAAAPQAAGEIPSPAGPPAPSQIPGGGGGAADGGTAPMIAELQRLQQHVKDHPEDGAAWTRIANLYDDAGMIPQAVGFYEKAASLLPKDANVWTDLGVCYRKVGETQKALEAFARAQEVDPSHWQSLYNQVVVYGLDLKKKDEAEAALQRLEAVNPAAPHLAELKQAVEAAGAGGS
jgi:tetratricopeptide (TPR) repeat protein